MGLDGLPAAVSLDIGGSLDLHVHRRRAFDVVGVRDRTENAIYTNQVMEKHPSSFVWCWYLLHFRFNVPVRLLRRSNHMVRFLFLFLHAS